MRAVIKDVPAPGVRVGDIETPTPATGEALVHIDTAGICGSDLHAYEWIPEYAWLEPLLPTVLGHELVGRLAAPAGSWAMGQRVAIRPATTCGTCEACLRDNGNVCGQRARIGYERPGGLANSVCAPLGNLHAIPEAVDRDTASLLEPLAVAVHAAAKVSLRPGATAAVIGVGAIGLLAVQVLRSRGAGRIHLIGTQRDLVGGGLGVGATFGADGVVAGQDDLSGLARTCDVVLVAAGALEAVATAIEVCRAAGQVVVVGLGIGDFAVDVDHLVRSEVQVIGSFGHVVRDWMNAIDMVAAGQVVGDGIISHRLDLEDAEQAFELLASGEARKVCIYPSGVDLD